jgi:hypothetical protein
MAVTVALGAVNAGQTFICTTTDDPVVVGTSNITFASQQSVANGQQTATSTTSQTIGTGPKTFTIQSGKAFQTGQAVLINETSNAANQMFGTVTSYSGTSLVVNVSATGGSGTHSDWTIFLYPSNAAAGNAPPIGTGNVTGPGSSTVGHIATFANTSGTLLQDGGAPVGGANSITPLMFANAAIAFGVGMLNGTLVATVAGNALTIAVKTLAGATPSPSDPVFFLFRDATNGFAVIELTSALSITVPSGATLGTVNGQANRIWVGVFNNGSTPVLGVYNSLDSSTLSIVPWDETSPANGTGITSGSTSPQIWYTASTLASVVFRVLGYVESTQATGGQWATGPTKVQLFAAAVKRPGDGVQKRYNTTTGAGSTPSATFVNTGQNPTITLTSAANVVSVRLNGTVQVTTTGTGGVQGSVRIVRGAISLGATTSAVVFGSASGNNCQAPVEIENVDLPNSIATTTYNVQIAAGVSGNTTNYPPAGGQSTVILEEIQT